MLVDGLIRVKVRQCLGLDAGKPKFGDPVEFWFDPRQLGQITPPRLAEVGLVSIGGKTHALASDDVHQILADWRQWMRSRR